MLFKKVNAIRKPAPDKVETGEPENNEEDQTEGGEEKKTEDL